MKTSTIKRQPTQIQSRKNMAERCEQFCMGLLEWDENTYNNFWLDAGCEYLHYACKGDTWAIEGLKTTRTFWKWWRNHWVLREEQFVMSAGEISRLHLTIRRHCYTALHSPAALAEEIYPNAVVLRESYNEMIGLLNKGK